MNDTRTFWAAALFAASLAGQSAGPTAQEPGAKLTLAPSEPLAEPRYLKPKTEPAGPTSSAAETARGRKVRPAILNLRPPGDPIYVVEEQEQDPTHDELRTYRRPKVERFSKDGEDVALKGYDVVSYLEKRAEKGKREFSLEYGSVTWLFTTMEHRNLFITDPDRYLPEYGGFCAYSVSKGYPATADPRAYSFEGGKLYLFFDKAVQNVWEQDRSGSLVKADRNWPKLHR